MNNLIATKLLIAVTSATIMLSALTSSVQAIDGRHFAISDDKEIQIYHEQDLRDKVYKVNGKQFYWRDLTKAQQARLEKIEEKISQIEQGFELDEAKLAKVTEEISIKSEAIEKEVAKLEQATIEVNKQKLSMNDLHELMSKLNDSVELNHTLIEQKSNEIAKLSKDIEKIDTAFIAEIEVHVKALEKELVAIAKELD